MRILRLTQGADPSAAATALLAAWAGGEMVGVAVMAESERLDAALGTLDPRQGSGAGGVHGPGVVVGSGGSTGGRRWCLQPLEHLRSSSEATGRWLVDLGIDPAACLHLNPLPLQHVSGLMPLVRSLQWGAEHRWLPAELLRQPGRLAADCALPGDRPVLLSLVPTQLQRLLGCTEARTWLRGCAVIWVGGAALPPPLAARARQAGLPLAPCYGATETAAMVCALPPERFLAGEGGCGAPLHDVRLRIDADSQAVEVCTMRLSPGWLEAGTLRPLPVDPAGWWRSGDGGRIDATGLHVLGRLDGAIHSGGETVFPEQLEARLRRLAQAGGLPLADVLMLGETSAEWGERLVALVLPQSGSDGEALLQDLRLIAAGWSPAERPYQWRVCRELTRSSAGKWERPRWRQWLNTRNGPPS